jgi:hypothetical protein
MPRNGGRRCGCAVARLRGCAVARLASIEDGVRLPPPLPPRTWRASVARRDLDAPSHDNCVPADGPWCHAAFTARTKARRRPAGVARLAANEVPSSAKSRHQEARLRLTRGSVCIFCVRT